MGRLLDLTVQVGGASDWLSWFRLGGLGLINYLWLINWLRKRKRNRVGNDRLRDRLMDGLMNGLMDGFMHMHLLAVAAMTAITAAMTAITV